MTDVPKRFCFVTTFYPPFNFGGDGIAVRRLAVELARRGHHVEVAHCPDAFRLQAPADAAMEEYDDDPRIVHHQLRSGAGALGPLVTQQTGTPGFMRRQLRTLLGSGGFDVVHFHNTSLVGITALSYGNAIKLYTMHEHWLVCPMHVLWRYNKEPCPGKQCIRCQLKGRRPPQFWRYTGLLGRSLRHVDAFIAPSQFTRAKHAEFGMRVAAPIVHIPNFLPVPEAVEGPDVSPHQSPYFLFVGRLERIKGAHVLVDVFTRYAKANLLLAGTGADADYVKALAQGHTHIKFLGAVSYAEIQQLMRHAIAVIAPSIGFEVFPTVVLEANAQGTPVIGHRLGPIPEMLDGRGGLTYGDESELVAALERLRTDAPLREAIGERGRAEYLASWTPDQHLSRYLALIKTLQTEKLSFA